MYEAAVGRWIEEMPDEAFDPSRYRTHGGAYTYSLAGRDYEAEALYRYTTPGPHNPSVGESNLYRYVHNQPTKFTDPSGLEIAVIQGANVNTTSLLRSPHMDIAVDRWATNPQTGKLTDYVGRAFFSFAANGVPEPSLIAGLLRLPTGVPIPEVTFNWLGTGTFATGVLKGRVYFGVTTEKDKAGGNVLGTLSTTPAQDMEFYNFLIKMDKREDIYDLVTASCQSFSRVMFNIAKKNYPDAVVWHAPGGLRMNNPDLPNRPGMWVR